MQNISNKRDFYFDNIKGLLIFLVLLGHFLAISDVHSKSGYVETIYSSIYLFHMPFFIFISGLFSKKFSLPKFGNLVCVYLIWQGLIYPFVAGLFRGSSFINEFNGFIFPKYSYWYILSLLFWKFISNFLPKNNFILAFLILLSFTPGLIRDVDLEFLSIGRTITLFPFFYLGIIFDRYSFKKIVNKLDKRLCVFSVFILLAISYYMFVDLNLSKKVLHFKSSYIDTVGSIQIGILIRILIFFISLMCIFCVSKFIPQDESILSKWGTNTLPIYLSHAALFSAMRTYVSVDDPVEFQFGFLILGIIVSYGYCEFICIDKINSGLKRLTDIRLF